MKPHIHRQTPTAARSAARRAGFSLAEIMVVILIIGLLVGYVGPKMFSSVDQAKVASAKRQMQTLKDQVLAYRMERNEWPDELEQLTQKDQRGNNYMDNIPEDPWGNQYGLQIEGSDVIVWCYGADGQPGGSEQDSDFSTEKEENN